MKRKLFDMPLGTRFRYEKDGKPAGRVLVFLDRSGYGLCASWEGNDGPVMGQQIFSVTETKEEMKNLEIYPQP
jgi:hypothetical protein